MTPQIVAEKAGRKDARGYDSFNDIKEILRKGNKKEDIVLIMGSKLWARKLQT